MRVAEEEFIAAEQDVLHKMAGLAIDPTALAVASNIWRSSQLLRRSAEQTVLSEHNLTWAGFSTLFIIWVWGPIEMRAIAESQTVTRSTVTSTVSLLERRGLCTRQQAAGNRRSVYAALTPAGEELIARIFPAFNRQEKRLIEDLTAEEAETLARLLRKIVSGQKARQDALHHHNGQPG